MHNLINFHTLIGLYFAFALIDLLSYKPDMFVMNP